MSAVIPVGVAIRSKGGPDDGNAATGRRRNPKMLDKGVVPWRKPWTSTFPTNALTKRSYTGFNALWLAVRDFGSPWWAGLRQWNKIGGRVRKGEHGAPVFVPILKKVVDESGQEGTSLLGFKIRPVFNAEQVEGARVPASSTRTHTPIEAAEAVVAGMPNRPTIETDTVQASYSVERDTVRIPSPGQFASAESYYATLFHELAHSTGHPSRLDRDCIGGMLRGPQVYSKEELIAEFGAAILCGQVGIAPAVVENSAAYIAGWRKALAGGDVSVMSAAGAGQRAAGYILGTVKTKEPVENAAAIA